MIITESFSFIQDVFMWNDNREAAKWSYSTLFENENVSNRDLINQCPRGEWLFQIAEALKLEIPRESYRPVISRAAKKVAEVAKMEGFYQEAKRLYYTDDMDLFTVEMELRKLQVGNRSLSEKVARALEYAVAAAAERRFSYAVEKIANELGEDCINDVKRTMGEDIIAALDNLDKV